MDLSWQLCARVPGCVSGWRCVFDLPRTFSAVSATLVRTSASRGSPTVLMLQCIISDIGVGVSRARRMHIDVP